MVRLWKCDGCESLNAPKRESCRTCGKAPPSEEERKVFANIALPILLAEHTRLKGELDETVKEEKRLRALAKRIETGEPYCPSCDESHQPCHPTV